MGTGGKRGERRGRCRPGGCGAAPRLEPKPGVAVLLGLKMLLLLAMTTVRRMAGAQGTDTRQHMAEEVQHDTTIPSRML
eukprot:356145-Chlamydomonas_euryale.AAC.2